jgi:protein-tyrosine sulfotransferase
MRAAQNSAGIKRQGTLTNRQLAVLRLAARGLSGRQIARDLGLSVRTVEDHFTRMRQRTGMVSASQLIAYAVAEGLVDAPTAQRRDNGGDPADGDHPVVRPHSASAGPGPVADPVFVLCNGRSGSTLLRFLLDAHPELACPPETNLPGLCVQLATVWSLIEGAPLSANRGDEPPEIPPAAIAGVRETMDRMVGSYLARRGKERYCDKSLGSARFVPLLRRVYPQARFICLYRHPMDVIASGAEACPWGLSGYGFDPYIAATPGNTVMALASFWMDNVQAALAAEESLPGVCLRLRYEDLVADPEKAAAAIFEFLGVAPAPGISQACFSSERERFGPADHKIWYTSGVSADSVGRGWSVPTAMISPQLMGMVNELAGRLGYLTVGDDWGTTEPPADLRAPAALGAAADAAPAGRNGATAAKRPGPGGDMEAGNTADADGTAPAPGGARSRRLGAALRAGMGTARPAETARRRQPHAGETFVAVAITKGAQRPAEYWEVDLGRATVTEAGPQAQDSSDWDVVGALEAWHRVIDGQLNLSAALRSYELRYCDNGEPTPTTADARLAILGRLLGLPSWSDGGAVSHARVSSMTTPGEP